MTNRLPSFAPRTRVPLSTAMLFAGIALGTWLAFPLAAQDAPAEAEKAETTEPAPTGDAEASPEAKRLLKDARERLAGYESVKADLVETVLIGSRRFRSEGVYLQGAGLQMRLEFRLKVKGADGQPLEGSLLQVCDGRILRTSQKIGKDLIVSRRDVTQILAAAEEFQSIEAETLKARLGLGGLPSLLASLQTSMRFDTVQQEEINGQSYIVLAGKWSKQYLSKLRRGGGGAAKEGEEIVLPPYIPDEVRVYLDAETLFPRRILYMKRAEKSLTPMLSLDFVNVQTNLGLSQDEFQFLAPEGVVTEDLTQPIIEQIKQAAERAKANKAGAAPDASAAGTDVPQN